MKSICFRIVSVLFIMLICTPVFAQKKGEKTTVFKVEIDCQSCVKNIEKNIPWEKGVTDLKCDMKTQTVAVTYKENKNNDANLIAAFKKLGKDAVVVPEGVKLESGHENCNHDHQSGHKH